MCTVTFIPREDAVFITHSRDEKSTRSPAIPPQLYRGHGQTLLYPKDSAAGGSWIAMGEQGNAAVLLNGGFTKHISSPPYRKSRGLCFLEIAANSDLKESYARVILDGIEPFTVLLYKENELLECRWDGSRKHVIELDASRPMIWSSVTLYDEAAIVKREKWFLEWISSNTDPSPEDILRFHLSGGEGDAGNDFRMNRNGVLLTVSVTGMEIKNKEGYMKYLDLQKETEYSKAIRFITAEPGSLSGSGKIIRNIEQQ